MYRAQWALTCCLTALVGNESPATQPGTADRVERLAVVDFEVIGSVGVQGAGAVVAEGLLSQFPAGRFDLVERRRLQSILTENDLQLTDIVARRKVHKILDVQWLVFGTVSRADDFQLNARRVDINGRIVRQCPIRAPTFEKLQDQLAKVGRVLCMDDEEYAEWHEDPQARFADLLAQATQLLAESVRLGDAREKPPAKELLSSALATLDDALALVPGESSAIRLRGEVIRHLTGLPERYTNTIGMQMIWTSAAVYLSRTEVPVEAFRRFVLESGHAFPGQEWDRIDGDRGTSPGPRYPMCLVTYYDAEAFCAWLSNKEKQTYRLPTCEEWNLVASEASRSRGAMNCAGTGGSDRWRESSPVGQFEQTPTGLFDLLGNVREWCTTDGESEGCATAGGSWWDSPWAAGERKRTGCGQRRNYIGFRIVAAPQSND